ncbi:MAG TPA: alanine racemase [Bordetella sp.]|uniref:alanine racemase n=1 Tax=Bordetella sp. TaxID=28081 RepID=UPI002ED4D3E5
MSGMPHGMNQTAQAQAHIDSTAVAHNLAQIRKRLGTSRARIWATVKADAYGHGIARVLPGLTDADGLAVRDLPEAQVCRAAGWHGPILVYGGLHRPDEVALLGASDLHLVISHAAQLAWLQAAAPSGQPPSVWLRYAGDTRLGGFDDEDYAQAYARCAALREQGRIADIGHLNHYARSEDADGIAEADLHFRRAIAGRPGPLSTCNCAALLLHPEHAAQTDWIRPGLMLYGASPIPDVHHGPGLGLRPVMRFTARLLGTQTLPQGAGLGYRAAFTAPQDMRVGLASCGYADGYPRHAHTGTPLLVDGQPTRLLGRPAMDTLAVDLTDVDVSGPDAVVVLWGDPRNTVEAVAASAGTISAALLTGLTPRVAMLGD